MKGLTIPFKKEFPLQEGAKFADQMVRVVVSDLTNFNPFSRIMGIPEEMIFELIDISTSHKVRVRVEKVFDFLEVNMLAKLIDLTFTSEQDKITVNIAYQNLISNKEQEITI